MEQIGQMIQILKDLNAKYDGLQQQFDYLTASSSSTGSGPTL